MSEGGSWKGLQCSFIGSTITNISSVNWAVQHNINDDARVLDWVQLLLLPSVGTHTCVFMIVRSCSQLLMSAHGETFMFTKTEYKGEKVMFTKWAHTASGHL